MHVCTFFLWCYYLSTEIHKLEVNPITELTHICLHVEVGKMHQAWLILLLLCHLDLLSITQITHFQLFSTGAWDPNWICPNKMTQIIPTIASTICYHTWRLLKDFFNFQITCKSWKTDCVTVMYRYIHASQQNVIISWCLC